MPPFEARVVKADGASVDVLVHIRNIVGDGLSSILASQNGAGEKVSRGRYILPDGTLSRDPLGGPEISVKPGEDATVSVKIPTSGTVQFYCEYHKGLGMIGTLKAS